MSNGVVGVENLSTPIVIQIEIVRVINVRRNPDSAYRNNASQGWCQRAECSSCDGSGLTSDAFFVAQVVQVCICLHVCMYACMHVCM